MSVGENVSSSHYRERKVGRGRIKEWRCPRGHWIQFVIRWRGGYRSCPECARGWGR